MCAVCHSCVRPVASSPMTVIDDYLDTLGEAQRSTLVPLRDALRVLLPGAEERISYRMPALFQRSVLLYYGAFKHHIGLFPPVTEPALLDRVKPYAGPKGNLQFPYGRPVPYELITAIVTARLAARLAKSSRRNS